jgi:hypothetical protein
MSHEYSPADYVPQPGLPAAAPARKRSTGAMILLFVGLGVMGIVGLIVLIGAAGAFFVLSSKTEEATDADRELIVNAREVSEQTGGLYEIDSDFESLEKTRYIDKTADVEYEYEDASEDAPLYIHCSVHEESSRQDAKGVYLTMQASVLAGLHLAAEGVEQVERNDLFRWGDDSKCGLLVSGGFNVGNYFFARQGNKVYCLLISGVCLEDRASLQRLLLPKLQRLEGHKL